MFQLGSKINYTTILFIGIILFRLWFGITHVPFSQDQARDVTLFYTYKQANVLVVPYGPKASVGDFYLAPLYYQISYWLFLLTSHGMAMHYATTFLESLTPIVLFHILKRVTSSTNAVIGAVTYAFSYQIIIFGTSMWNPNLIPLLSATILLSSIQLSDKNSSSWYILLFLSAFITGIHFHYQMFVLLPFVIFVVAMYLKQRRNLAPLFTAIILILLSFTGYFVTEYSYNWPNTLRIIQFATQSHPNIYDRVSKPSYLVSYFPGFIERTLVGFNVPYLLMGRIIWFTGIAALFIMYFRKPSKYAFFIAFYLCSIFLMLRVYKGDKLDFYLGTLYMLPAILVCAINSIVRNGGVILAVGAIAISGYMVTRAPEYNGYTETNNFCSQLQAIAPTFYPIIHNNDLIQLVWYCKQTTHLTLTPSISLLVDFCQPTDDCGDRTITYCTNTSDDSSRIFKQSQPYNVLMQVMNRKIIAVIGSINNTVEASVHKSFLPTTYLLPNNPIPPWLANTYSGQERLF